MEKAIKFKAWDSYQNKMYEWDEICDQNSKGNLTLTNLLNNLIEHIKPIEFTGLKDNSNKEIYDNDLFEIIFSDCLDGFVRPGKETTYIPIVGKVLFNCGSWKIEVMHPQLKKLVYMDLFNLLKNPEKVVIGNVFQNPELLNPKS